MFWGGKSTRWVENTVILVIVDNGEVNNSY